MNVKLDLGPLEELIAQTEEIAMAACADAAPDVLCRLKEQEPIVTGSLVDSLGIKIGSEPGLGYAEIGPESDKVASDTRETRPVEYQKSVEAEHGNFMQTLLGSGDVEALADGAAHAIARVLNDAVAG